MNWVEEAAHMSSTGDNIELLKAKMEDMNLSKKVRKRTVVPLPRTLNNTVSQKSTSFHIDNFWIGFSLIGIVQNVGICLFQLDLDKMDLD